jgi:hypothetical protein
MLTNPEEQARKFSEWAKETGIIDGGGGDNPGDQGAPLSGEPDPRPLIKIPADKRELIDFCRECGKELGKHDRLFRRDRTVVAINKEKARLDPMTPRAMCSFAQRYIRFFKFKTVENSKGEKETETRITNIATETAAKLIESWEFIELLPEIRRVNPVRLPVFREDGRVDLLKPGYFADKGFYTVESGMEYDETMTRERAVAVLNDLLKDFPFVNERSKASVIAGMLTMFCATMLSARACRPGFLFVANAPGAGKTLLVKLIVLPVCGSCELQTLPRKEETKKVLDTLAIEASLYAVFDNIRGTVQSEAVESFITAATWGGRPLGESTKFSVENVTTVFLTANQAKTSDDMAERVLFVELFIQEADNRDRIIPRVIDETFLIEPKRRSQILSALCALVRAWDLLDGKPEPPAPMQRFEEWSRIVAGVVMAAGYADPLAKPEITSGADVERRDMHSLVKFLAPGPETKPEGEPPTIRAVHRFDEMMEIVKENGLFDDVEIWSGRSQREMWEKDGSLSAAGRSFFGRLFVRFSGRLFRVDDGRGFRFQAEGRGNTRKYVVELVVEAEPF